MSEREKVDARFNEWQKIRNELREDFPRPPDEDYETWIAKIEHWTRALLQPEGEPVGEPDLYVATRQPRRGDGQVWIGWPPQSPEGLEERRRQGWYIEEYYTAPLAPETREREDEDFALLEDGEIRLGVTEGQRIYAQCPTGAMGVGDTIEEALDDLRAILGSEEE